MKRLRPSREAFVLALFLLLVASFAAFIALRQAQLEQADQVYTPYSSHSARANGALALHEWANALGYRAQRIENTTFRVSDDTRLLFLFSPREIINQDETRYILRWVERGNVLVIADRGGLVNNGLLRALEIQTASLDHSGATLTLGQPLADAALGALDGSASSGLETRRNDIAPYMTAAQPILLRLARGQGAIWILSEPALLDNAHLADENNAKFARALLANAPPGGVIAFDEYHLGFQSNDANSALPLLYNTPWGWGLLFAALVLFGYLILNGQRLGRTVPVQRTLARRTPSEYVVSMANLFRRANKRGMVLQHYRYALKRRLGRPFHLNPDMSDEHYLELITRMRPELDHAELARILNRLRRADTTEADLVKTVEHAVTFGAREKK